MGGILVANRGEVALRIMRAARGLGLGTVAVFAEDDADSLHVRKADEARLLPGVGAAAYLDGEAIVAAARAAGNAIHPGYGFVSENAPFARLCAQSGITFVGPTPELLALFGDKVAARALARELDVPVLPGVVARCEGERLVHRGQPTPAGRAHRHRGGDRRRPREGADPGGARGLARRRRSRAPAGVARLRGAGAREPRDVRARRHRPAERGHADRLPRTPTNKVEKYRLRQQFEAELAAKKG